VRARIHQRQKQLAEVDSCREPLNAHAKGKRRRRGSKVDWD